MKVKDYLAAIGKKGGEAGTGKAKIRGDADYYKRISAKAAKARKAKTPLYHMDHCRVHDDQDAKCSCGAVERQKRGKK